MDGMTHPVEPDTEAPHAIVIGAGFGGLAAAVVASVVLVSDATLKMGITMLFDANED